MRKGKLQFMIYLIMQEEEEQIVCLRCPLKRRRKEKETKKPTYKSGRIGSGISQKVNK